MINKQYKMMLNLLKLMCVLTLVELIMCLIEQTVLHVVLLAIVSVAHLLILIIYIIIYNEYKKNIFELNEENVSIRLVDFDDYQLIREYVDEHPLENSEDEVKRLEEYEKITIDYCRLHYHYIVLIDNVVKGIIYSKPNKKTFEISFVKIDDEVKDRVVSIIEKIAKSKNVDIIISN